MKKEDYRGVTGRHCSEKIAKIWKLVTLLLENVSDKRVEVVNQRGPTILCWMTNSDVILL